MKQERLYEQLKKAINPKKTESKEWFLSLLDENAQRSYENSHISNVMLMLRVAYINPLKLEIKELSENKKKILQSEEYGASNYAEVVAIDNKIKELKNKIDTFKCFFEEPYFARMDLVDNVEGYNSYYIGKKGEEKLEIIDWRAPLARRYYQKSKIFFSINEYDYKTILRRAIQTKNGKVVEFKNEYLSLKDYLSREEIDGRDEELIFDPYLRSIIKSRKEEQEVKDIIETIQEKQYELITLPERDNFVLQGCAGSGKTMVLLHRLSYLMYNNEELKSRDVLVITPSNSFNDFIDELATVLELEKVRTVTLSDYFNEILFKLGLDIKKKINPAIVETEEYLRYIYSPAFVKDITKSLDKVYDSVHGMLTSEECRDVIGEIIKSCRRQNENYNYIKNASLRIRRTVLGEIKEKAEGGIYYTKPFREFMNGIQSVEEFFSKTLVSKRSENQSYFYKQLVDFYKSSSFVAHNYRTVIGNALCDLESLKTLVEKELADLKRYKYYAGDKEFFTYIDRIQRREELLKEIAGISVKVSAIGDDCAVFSDFYEALRGERNFVALGKCESFMDFVRFFYKNTVKKAKIKFGVLGKGLVETDAYSICMILGLLGEDLPLRYTLVFVDEGQDISSNEYALLKMINKTASFNVFGDLKQKITPFRGVETWRECFDYPVYLLNQNYRNTNQIVDFVSETLDADMRPIGFDGPEVKRIKARGLASFFRDVNGLKAIIAKKKFIDRYARKSYNILSETGKISKTKINVMTVYESKGLEFSAVAVDDEEMTPNEKYIAYTRALMSLAVIGG